MGSDMRHCVLTLVERKTGYAIVKKLKARQMNEVTRAATQAIRRHRRKFKTITFDNGTEFHDYARLEQRFPTKIYFATPYHSWERGSNENFNGLLRQYLPKGTCLSTVPRDAAIRSPTTSTIDRANDTASTLPPLCIIETN